MLQKTRSVLREGQVPDVPRVLCAVPVEMLSRSTVVWYNTFRYDSLYIKFNWPYSIPYAQLSITANGVARAHVRRVSASATKRCPSACDASIVHGNGPYARRRHGVYCRMLS